MHTKVIIFLIGHFLEIIFQKYYFVSVILSVIEQILSSFSQFNRRKNDAYDSGKLSLYTITIRNCFTRAQFREVRATENRVSHLDTTCSKPKSR